MVRRGFLTASFVLALSSSGCSSDPAPTGTLKDGYEVGNRLENHTFTGRKAGETAHVPFALADFKATHQLLVLNVAAGWCSPCKEEAKEIQNTIAPKYAGKVAFVSIMLEDSARNPATVDNVDNWIKAYSITSYAVARDPDRWVAKFFDPNNMPLNVVVDLSTMKILSKVIGADLLRVQADIDKNLK
ncbi:MAG: TlpA family protein disulfide reductase [Myxococcales bacterium]|nr:TlpA family protein disulfide reductase [Myxococcales bacterium]